MNGIAEDVSPNVALTESEIKILDQVVKESIPIGFGKKNLKMYLYKIARLGGYLARKSDPPPGIIVMWRGLNRLSDFEKGFLIQEINVGN